MKRLILIVIFCCLFFGGIVLGFMIVLGFFSSSSSVLVPNLDGVSVEEAQNLLNEKNLKLKILEERYDLKREKGSIISFNPSYGMSVKKGQSVYVVVSKGIEKVVMPDLTDKNLQEAQIELSKLGLKLKSLSYISDRREEGVVISQYPSSNAIIPKESDCFLLISKGGRRPIFVMPNILKKDFTTVSRSLSEYGFKVIPSGSNEGMITTQKPLSGIPVDASEVIFVGVQK